MTLLCVKAKLTLASQEAENSHQCAECIGQDGYAHEEHWGTDGDPVEM